MPSPQEIARQQIQYAFDRDFDALRKLYSPSVQYVDPDGELTGVEAVMDHLKQQVGPFPDATHEVRFVGGDDAFAMAEWQMTGTNTGSLTMPDGSTLPATGLAVVLPVVTIYDVRDGLIVSERNYYDNLGLYAQLGLLPE